MMRSLGVHLRESLSGLRRDWRTATLSLLVVTSSALATAVVLVASTAADRAVARLAEQADLSVFLAVDTAPDARVKVEGVLRQDASVAQYEYVSPEAAAIRFRRAFPDLAPLLDDGAPLPPSYDIRLKSGAGVAPAVNTLVSSLKAIPGVASVRFERELAERGAALTSVVRRVGTALALVLALAGALTVFSIVRLSYVARRDEVEILHLVGVPLSTIRGPFVVEGMLQGLFGALLALIGLWVGLRTVGARLTSGAEAAFGVTLPLTMSFSAGMLLVLGATALGGVAAWLAVRSAARALVL